MDIRVSAGKHISSTDILPITKTDNSPGDKQSESTPQTNESLANIAIFNLLKQRMVFGQLQTEFNQIAKIQVPDSISFMKIYSYKPALYLGLALFAHLRSKKFGAAWMIVHGSVFMMINQWDMNQGMRKINQEKWSEYQQAMKNYQLALNMTNVSIWGYLKEIMQQKFTTQDYKRLLTRMPH